MAGTSSDGGLMKEKRLALLIVTDDYADLKLKSLHAPEADGNSLANVLKDKAIGNYDVQLIVNEPHYQVLEHIEASLKECNRNDLVILYFSGHGIKDQYGHLFFAMTNTNADLLAATAIPATLINDLMRRCRSKRQVLLLDTCYSGAFAKGMMVRSGEEIGVGSFFDQGSGHAVMTASDAMQYAFEGDNISGESIGSVFTSTIVEGLKTGKADSDLDGVISFDDLFEYVQSQVSDKMPEQQPRKWVFNVEGKLILAKNPKPVAKKLPEAVLEAINSPLPGVVEGVIRELKTMLKSHDLGTALSAKLTLQKLTVNDSRRVSSAAKQALHAEEGIQEKQTVIEEAPPPDLPRIPTTEKPEPDMVHIEKQVDESQPDAKLIALIAVNMFFGVFTYFSIGHIRIDLFYLQIFSCLFIGYHYHRRVALIAGALIFLPNLVLHLIGNYIEATPDTATNFLDFHGDSFRGRAHLFETIFTCRTLGVAYLYYALFAFAVAITKAKLNSLLETATSLSLKKMEYRRSSMFGYAMAIILLPISIAFGPLQVIGFYALLPLFSLWVYRYGLRQTKKLFVVFLIIQILAFDYTIEVSIFTSVEYVYLPIFILLLLVYSDLKVDNRKSDKYGFYVLSMILICLFTNLTLRTAQHLAFQAVALALPWLFFLGYKYGCRSGLLGGVILGCTMIIKLYISDILVWGGYSTKFLMAAPMIGYLGGSDFIKKDFLGNGMKIFGIYYGAILLAITTNYGFTTERNMDDIVSMGASIILLLIFSIFAKKPQQY